MLAVWVTTRGTPGCGAPVMCQPTKQTTSQPKVSKGLYLCVKERHGNVTIMFHRVGTRRKTHTHTLEAGIIMPLAFLGCLLAFLGFAYTIRIIVGLLLLLRMVN